MLIPLFQLTLLLLCQQVQANRIINDVLAQWDKNQQAIRSAYFEIELESIEHESFRLSEKLKTIMRVSLLFKDKDECWLKATNQRQGETLATTYLFRGSKFYIIDHLAKTVICTTGISLTRQSFTELCDWIGAVPFFSTGKELARKYEIVFKQLDKHYTWLQLTPKTRDRSWTIAQIALINYESKWAPRNFPLHFKYRDGCGTIHTWRFTKVVINDDQFINENSFRDEEQPLKDGWKLTEANKASK